MICRIEPPVWSGLDCDVSAAAQLFGRHPGCRSSRLEPRTDRTQIAAIAPRLAVFVIYGQQPSASTQCMPAGRKVCEILAYPFRHSHPGDGHASLGAAASGPCSKNHTPMSVKGEGPATILGLLIALRAPQHSLRDVPGLWYYGRQGLPWAMRPRRSCPNLDRDVPGQAWDLLDMTLYRAHNWHCFGESGCTDLPMRHCRPAWVVPSPVRFAASMLPFPRPCCGRGVRTTSSARSTVW